MPASDALRELVEQHALAVLVRQARAERVGAALSLRYRIDVLGRTLPGGGWRWAWADDRWRTDETLSASLLWQLGTRYGIAELVAEEVAAEVPAAWLAVVGAGEASAEGFRHAPDGTVRLVRHVDVADAPFVAADLIAGLEALRTLDGVDAEAVLDAFAEGGLDEYAVELGRRSAEIAGPGGVAVVELDRRGRIKRVGFEAEDAVPPPDDAVGAVPGVAADEVEEQEALLDVGVLTVPAGERLAVLDPFVAVPGFATGTLPTDAGAGGTHRVVVTLHEDPAGGERVELAYVLLDPDAEPVTWQPVGDVLVDSGVVAFATADAAIRCEHQGPPAGLGAALAATTQPTWEHGAADGLVAFSAGLGDGEVRVLFGFDREDRLVRIGIDCLSGWELDELEGLEPAEEASPGDTPGPGLQRAYLLAGALGGAADDENVVLLPPAANRALAALDRRLLVATAGSETDVVGQVTPEYDDPSYVPSRIRVVATDGPDPFDITLEIPRPA